MSEASKKLIVLSTNGAGIVNRKMDSLRNEVKAVEGRVEFKWMTWWFFNPFKLRKAVAQSAQSIKN